MAQITKNNASKAILNANNELLNTNQTAKIFGVHPETIRRWDNEGKLKAIRIGIRGHRKYKRGEVEKLLS